MDSIYNFPLQILKNYDLIWTFLLLFVRFLAMMILVPGIGGGATGLTIRMPAIMVLTFTACFSSPRASLSADWAGVIGAIFAELFLGILLGLIPAMVIAGVQTAMQLASTTMGLSAGQMYDPSMEGMSTSLGVCCGNLAICFFMLLGGHHFVLYVTSGLDGSIVPGTYMITETSLKLLIDRSAAIFEAGVMISAPAIAAILLTKFVMGLISRAVPQINIFIIAFPLTIGIGLILTALSLPDMCSYLRKDFEKAEQELYVVAGETQNVNK